MTLVRDWLDGDSLRPLDLTSDRAPKSKGKPGRKPAQTTPDAAPGPGMTEYLRDECDLRPRMTRAQARELRAENQRRHAAALERHHLPARVG